MVRIKAENFSCTLTKLVDGFVRNFGFKSCPPVTSLSIERLCLGGPVGGCSASSVPILYSRVRFPVCTVHFF